jgi:DNA-binding transcriptional ArsR family regulator
MNKKLSISSFTPSTMSHELLELLFVQREELLRSVVDDLAESVTGMKRYLMLVGERGMGKTHFVSLVYHRLKLLPEMQDKLLVAWLREEEYGVNSWLYLIVEILRALAEEGLETQGYIDRLAKMGVEEAGYLANRLLAEAIGDKTLVIITENLDKLLAGLGDREQWKFRAFLQEQNSCSILATTPKISLDTSSKDRPFFGFFSRIDLPRFSLDDGLAMLTKVTELSEDQELADFLKTELGKSRVRAFHHLFGGNFLVYTLFSQLVTKNKLIDLLSTVIELLDKLTPYCRSRIDYLRESYDQQKILVYLLRGNRAVMVKEIAAQCFISSERAASNALRKLKDNGYVSAIKQGREVYYEVSDNIMRLCLDIGNSRLGYLRAQVNFLMAWYEPISSHSSNIENNISGQIHYPDKDTLSPVKIFISYSHDDRKMKDRLILNLSPLVQKRVVLIWQDEDILAGAIRQDQIKSFLEQANIILCLVSPDFLSSEDFYTYEITTAIEKMNEEKTFVIPVYLRPCYLDNLPLSSLQGLPKNMQPISTWQDQDSAFLEVAKGIIEVCDDIRRSRQSVSTR